MLPIFQRNYNDKEKEYYFKSANDLDLMLYVGRITGFSKEGVFEDCISKKDVKKILDGLPKEVSGKKVQYHVAGNLKSWYSGQFSKVVSGGYDCYTVTYSKVIKGLSDMSERHLLGVE